MTREEAKKLGLTRRWRMDGGDYLTGSMKLGGLGGTASWHIHPPRGGPGYGWKAFGWNRNENLELGNFQHEGSAMRAVERWLKKQEGRK